MLSRFVQPPRVASGTRRTKAGAALQEDQVGQFGILVRSGSDFARKDLNRWPIGRMRVEWKREPMRNQMQTRELMGGGGGHHLVLRAGV